MNTKQPKADLSDNLRRYLDSVPPVSQEDLAELGRAVGELDTDPAFQADFMKGRFIEQVLEAMSANGLNQSQIAEAWGKSRQYLSKLFNEDKRVNFTIETMTQLAAIVGRRLRLELEPAPTGAATPEGSQRRTVNHHESVKPVEKQRFRPKKKSSETKSRNPSHPIRDRVLISHGTK